MCDNCHVTFENHIDAINYAIDQTVKQGVTHVVHTLQDDGSWFAAMEFKP